MQFAQVWLVFNIALANQIIIIKRSGFVLFNFGPFYQPAIIAKLNIKQNFLALRYSKLWRQQTAQDREYWSA